MNENKIPNLKIGDKIEAYGHIFVLDAVNSIHDASREIIFKQSEEHILDKTIAHNVFEQDKQMVGREIVEVTSDNVDYLISRYPNLNVWISNQHRWAESQGFYLWICVFNDGRKRSKFITEEMLTQTQTDLDVRSMLEDPKTWGE